MHNSRKSCTTRNALAIARWEDNKESWLKGEFFGLRSRDRDLQELVGDGGTLWIIVSRRQTKAGRSYSLSFRLDNCRKYTFPEAGKFGKYAVVGDPDRSTLFATNDARLLLLSLRFDPFKPIDHGIDPSRKNKKERTDRLKIIGQSIQTPRCLTKLDVKLLMDYGAITDRWSLFISYRRTDADTRLAKRLFENLQRRGINVFRDLDALRGGQEWWGTIQRAIERARNLVVIIGPTTHESEFVKNEIRHAKEKKLNIIPLLAGGSLDNWDEFQLKELHAITHIPGRWKESMRQVAAAIHLRTDTLR